jgi:hypothetical protein
MNLRHKKAEILSAAILCFLCPFVANSQTPNPKLVTIFVVGDSTANNRTLLPHEYLAAGCNQRRYGSAAKAPGSDLGDGRREIRDGDQLDEFAIAGADHKWYWANAKITGKDAIEVWSDAVPQPVAIRYAFNNNPRHPNLTNETGLPAAPFRTDNWPGPTDGKK